MKEITIRLGEDKVKELIEEYARSMLTDSSEYEVSEVYVSIGQIVFIKKDK